MRRRIGTCLLAVLMLAALAVPSFAAGIETPVVKNAYKDKCTVTVADADKGTLKVSVTAPVSNAQYLVFVLNEEGKPAEANIQYINQNGSGAFVDPPVYPKELKAGEYYIYLSSDKDTSFDGTQPVATFKYVSDTPAVKLGDVDGDKLITSADALLALQIAGELYTPTTDEYKAANVDGDSTVTAADALMILQYAGNLISSWD